MAWLAAQRAPLVIACAGDEAFRHTHETLWRYIDDQYRNAGTSSFGVPGKPWYTVWVPRARAVSYAHAASGMPCFW